MSEDNGRSRVIARLEAAVAAGAPGQRLPSVRELMDELRVGPLTVQRAVAELVARGDVEARPGRGTFVAAPAGAAPAAGARPARPDRPPRAARLPGGAPR